MSTTNLYNSAYLTELLVKKGSTQKGGKEKLNPGFYFKFAANLVLDVEVATFLSGSTIPQHTHLTFGSKPRAFLFIK